jgi:pSer/pThr/pTyr-binding forkhead associated (FHA) protein
MPDQGAGNNRSSDADREQNCYLACFPARPIRLSRDRQTTIGRSDGNTIVLADSDVSRKHAVVECIDGRFVIKDLGSRNGITVNDAKMPEAILAPNDMIQIGNRMFTFLAGDDQAVRRLFMRKRQEQHSGDTDVIDVRGIARPMSGFAGNLGDFGLAELLQALELGRKTGRVTLVCEGRRGEMLIREGQVLSANLGDLEEEDAVYGMLGLEAGRFEFENCPIEVTPIIRTKTASLLMEGFRRIDESQRSFIPYADDAEVEEAEDLEASASDAVPRTDDQS